MAFDIGFSVLKKESFKNVAKGNEEMIIYEVVSIIKKTIYVQFMCKQVTYFVFLQAILAKFSCLDFKLLHWFSCKIEWSIIKIGKNGWKMNLITVTNNMKNVDVMLSK